MKSADIPGLSSPLFASALAKKGNGEAPVFFAKLVDGAGQVYLVVHTGLRPPVRVDAAGLVPHREGDAGTPVEALVEATLDPEPFHPTGGIVCIGDACRSAAGAFNGASTGADAPKATLGAGTDAAPELLA